MEEKRNYRSHIVDLEANLKWRATRKPGTKRGGRVPWLPRVKQEGREPKQDGGGAALQAWARRDSYSDTGSSAASAAAAAEFNAAAGLGPPDPPVDSHPTPLAHMLCARRPSWGGFPA